MELSVLGAASHDLLYNAPPLVTLEAACLTCPHRVSCVYRRGVCPSPGRELQIRLLPNWTRQQAVTRCLQQHNLGVSSMTFERDIRWARPSLVCLFLWTMLALYQCCYAMEW